MKGLKTIILISLMLTFCACSKNDEAPVDLEEYFSLEVIEPASGFIANGKLEVEVIAVFPKGLSGDLTTVTFSTSAGTFKDNNGNNSIELPIVNREAKAILTLGTKGGRFNLQAEVTSDGVKYAEFEEIELLDHPSFFRLYLNRSSVLADGHSQVVITAEFNEPYPESINQITFSTQGGTFVNNENKNYIEKEINIDNIATAILTVGTTPNTYIIKGIVDLNGEEIVDEESLLIGDIEQDSIMTLSSLNEHPFRADNFSKIEILATIINPSYNQNITFSTNNGNFQCNDCSNSANLQIEDNGEVRVFLKMPNEVEDLLISASIESPQFTRSISFPILPAYPDNLIIDPSSLTIDTITKNVDLDIYLERNIGRGEVSKGVWVGTEAVQLDNISGEEFEVGRFSPVILRTESYQLNSPNAEVTFHNDVLGKEAIDSIPIKIRIFTVDDYGEIIRDSVLITHN